MAKSDGPITPEDRLVKWKKLWATPRKLDEASTDEAFDEFTDVLVPSHMHKLFLKTFGHPKTHFGNRFFKDSAQYHEWSTRFSTLGTGEGAQVEVTVIYGSPEKLEAYVLRGESRRTLKDVVIDDWYSCCAIARSPDLTLYLFIQRKMSGCLVLPIQHKRSEPEDEESE